MKIRDVSSLEGRNYCVENGRRVFAKGDGLGRLQLVES